MLRVSWMMYITGHSLVDKYTMVDILARGLVLQKPHLSTTVRQFISPGSALDIDKLYIERKCVLEQRRQSR